MSVLEDRGVLREAEKITLGRLGGTFLQVRENFSPRKLNKKNFLFSTTCFGNPWKDEKPLTAFWFSNAKGQGAPILLQSLLFTETQYQMTHVSFCGEGGTGSRQEPVLTG